MRSAFMDELYLAAEKDDSIVLVVGDLGFGVVADFARRFPKQFINAGVAEQNMMGLSAGLASEGFKVFAYSIGNFPTFRCAEQIRNDIDYHKLPVTVVAVGGGLSYGNLGYSHHAIQDIALMRTFPNMMMATPGDPMETRACIRYLLANPQPSYLRLEKAGEPSMHPRVPNLEPGKWLKVKEGIFEKTFLTAGGGLGLAFNRLSQEEDLNKWFVHSMPLWNMEAKKKQAEQARNFKEIVTVENHLLDGDFGSWMLESLKNDKGNISKVEIRALSSKVCGMVGDSAALVLESGFWA